MAIREKFDLWIKKMGQHRGSPRLWFDTPRIAAAGLVPGVRFSITPKGLGIQLCVDKQGAYSVSSKVRSGKTIPVVDINNRGALESIAELLVVRIVIREDSVWILPLASELAKRERLTRLIGKLNSGEPLATASLAHGCGIASHASHRGLEDAGLKSSLAFANEIDEDYALQSILHNDVTTDTTMLISPLQELVQDEWVMGKLPKVEVLELGLPCSGASRAGKSKNRISMMESHSEVGHLVYGALALIAKVQPCILVLENVEPYSQSASAEILRHQLRDMGYHVAEVVLSAQDFGCIENRIRWFLLAYTDGLECSVANIVPKVAVRVPKLGELLDPVALDAACWSELTYLRDKEVRDSAAGNSFSMQIVTAESVKVGVLRKHYSKGGSTDPVLQHPEKPELLRKLSLAEHLRIKAIPMELLEGVSTTKGHQMAGQSVAYMQVRAIYRECVGPALVHLRDFGAKLMGLNAPSDRLEAAIG